MNKKLLLSAEQLSITITRLAFEILEAKTDQNDTYLIGLQPRGIRLAQCIHDIILKESHQKLSLGFLDNTFFRDDFRTKKRGLLPKNTEIDQSIEGKHLVLIDDVIFTGRSIRASLDTLISFGRPAKTELLALIDRKFNREFPIQPSFVGISVNTLQNQHILLEWDGAEKTKCTAWICEA